MKVQVDVPTGEVEKALLAELRATQRKVSKLEGQLKQYKEREAAFKKAAQAFSEARDFLAERFDLYTDYGF